MTIPRLQSPGSASKLPPSAEEYAASIPATLRERLTLTRRLDQVLKDECLGRLDGIAKREPDPRRPSWGSDDSPVTPKYREAQGSLSDISEGTGKGFPQGDLYAPPGSGGQPIVVGGGG